MTQVQFSPESWSRGGQAYLEEAAALRSAVSSHLASLDVNALGSGNGGHPIDITLAVVVPVVKDAFLEACENLAANLEAVGTLMNDTGAAYAAVEAGAAADAGQSTTL
ncbi:hypothetical protein ACPCG0_07635 [Propionibacteriaceae bacterium Y1923]|uniref:hypothetical protein n=1 Tax=Aestuariimicrobium sp. Y1814 TaxID=3418742 RepID=UPI003C1D1FA8